MRLRAICASCDREVALERVTTPGPLQGLCPWCGIALAPHNTARLVEATSRVQHSLEDLVSSLQLLARLPRRFRLVTDDLAVRAIDDRGT
jgi:hypothetical protein